MSNRRVRWGWLVAAVAVVIVTAAAAVVATFPHIVGITELPEGPVPTGRDDVPIYAFVHAVRASSVIAIGLVALIFAFVKAFRRKKERDPDGGQLFR